MQQKITIIIESDEPVEWIIPSIDDQLSSDENIISYAIEILQSEIN